MYVQHRKYLNKFILPVFHDLQFRLAFRLLPRLVALFFAARPTWLDIALGQKLQMRDDWEAIEVFVSDVWHILRPVTIHFLWSDRNRCLFDGRQLLLHQRLK
ncbi:hypothetical protein Plhal703r1_c80g0173771 [Plasmopara halstedii]